IIFYKNKKCLRGLILILKISCCNIVALMISSLSLCNKIALIMKKYILIFTTCALGVLNFTSCDKKDNPSPESNVANPELILDSSNHAIVSDTICGHLENNVLKLSNGDTLKMFITIKGEYALSQYKIAAH